MLTIIAGYIGDLLFGDPYWLPHPIRFIGKGIEKTEKLLLKNSRREWEKTKGVILTSIIVSMSYLGTFFLSKAAFSIHKYIGYGVEAFIIFQILATKSLDRESRKVLVQLEKKDLTEARRYLSYIVGRDTTELSEQEISRGAIETVAENISDGIIAPLFYIFLGGAPLGMAYKAVNTLDSMVGYKNEKYINFGWASARLDDAANYIPARLTGLFICIASVLGGFNWKNSMLILLRDRKNHKSPNSGYPEAAVAGALEIQIGGVNTYFGEKVYKPTIGDPIKPLDKEDIKRTIRIMYMTSAVGLIIMGILKYMVAGGVI